MSADPDPSTASVMPALLYQQALRHLVGGRLQLALREVARAAGRDTWAQATLGQTYALLGLDRQAQWLEQLAQHRLSGGPLATLRAWQDIRAAQAQPSAASLWQAQTSVDLASQTPHELSGLLWQSLAHVQREAGALTAAYRSLQAATAFALPLPSLLAADLAWTAALNGEQVCLPSLRTGATPDERVLAALTRLYLDPSPQTRTGLARVLPGVERLSLRRTAAVVLADALSRTGAHIEALHALHSATPFPQVTVPALWGWRGILLRRSHHDQAAMRDLRAALAAPATLSGDLHLRLHLHLADVLHRQGQSLGAWTLLRDALPQLPQLSAPHLLAPDLYELSDLLSAAVLEPDLNGAVEQAWQAVLRPPHRLGLTPEPEWTLDTRGRAVLRHRSQDIPLRWPGTALLLAYLALQGTVTRQEAQLALWPDLPPSKAVTHFRQALAEIRTHLGPQAVQLDGPHRQPSYTLRAPLTLLLTEHPPQPPAQRFLAPLPHTGWVADIRRQQALAEQFSRRRSLDRHPPPDSSLQ